MIQVQEQIANASCSVGRALRHARDGRFEVSHDERSIQPEDAAVASASQHRVTRWRGACALASRGAQRTAHVST